MNEQERQEVAELILRSIHLHVVADRVSAISGHNIAAVLIAEDNANTAQRELWEALYRIRLDDTDQSRQRTGSTDSH